ncbi:MULTISPECIES: EpsG family protein [unclassified Enterococcus]|jgi:hypothetical protein|uniref:EpsG family protein n=1 Tax=unclassified Enterococcus TaxID=2608891 RepID=UPI003D2E4379
MAVYITMFLAAECFAFIAMYIVKNIEKINVLIGEKKVHVKSLQYQIFTFLAIIPLFLVAALRYKVGTDYTVYSTLQIPELLRGVDYKLKNEYLYQYLIKIGMSMGDVQWVFVLTHAVLLFFIWQAFRNSSLDLRFSIFLFIFGASFNTSLNIMRQSIATAVFLFAIKYIIERKLVKYLCMMIIAFLFHKTAVAFIPMYFLPKIKIPPVYGPIIVVVSYLGSGILRKMLIGLSTTFNLYTNYFNSAFDNNNTQWDFIFFNLTFLVIAVAIHSYYPEDDLAAFEKYTRISPEKINIYSTFFYNLALFTTIICSLTMIIPNSTRIIFMFSIGQTLYMPYLLSKVKSTRMRFLLYIVLILLYLAYFYRLIIMRNLGETLPYHFIGGSL